MSNLDWPKLVSQGRAKDNGVAWNEAELEALDLLIRETGLSRPDIAPYVRAGIRTLEEYEAAKAKEAKEGKRTEHKTRKELVNDAAAAGVVVNDAMSDTTIAKQTEQAVNAAETAETAPAEETSTEAANAPEEAAGEATEAAPAPKPKPAAKPAAKAKSTAPKGGKSKK